MFTGKLAGDDVPPPGAELVTVTLSAPAAAMSVARIFPTSDVAPPNVVMRGLPLTLTVAPFMKPVPNTTIEKAAPPAVAFVGEKDVIVGTGLFSVKFAATDAPPPGAGLVTVTGSVPPVTISDTRIDAVTCAALTNVVVSALPLKFTTAPLTKPVPFTVSVNAAPPAVPLDGDSVVIAGSGLFTAKFVPADLPPPGVGLVTVIGNDPLFTISVAKIEAVTCVALTNVVVRALPL